MRYTLFILILVLKSALAVQEVDQPIGSVFIPDGYDNDDSVQMVATGRFRNSCYQMGLYSSEVDKSKKEIKIHLTAYTYQNRCLQVEVPFFQTIYLGRLSSPGSYKIIDETTNEAIGVLNIKAAPPEGSGTDDAYYASMLDAFVKPTGDGKHVLHLRGVYSNTCLTVTKVEIRHQSDVLVVLPYLQLADGVNCKITEEPFEITKSINEPLPAKFLLHVRSMGGQALNKIVILSGEQK